MREHIFREDPWLAPDSMGRKVCMCGLMEYSAYHKDPPPRPEGDVSDRIIGEGETGDHD
jgi:hypothetical protein